MRWLLACELLSLALAVGAVMGMILERHADRHAEHCPWCYLYYDILFPVAWWLTSHPQARRESKRSFAQLVSLGNVRGRFESLLANLRTDLMRGRQNGTEESNSGSTAGSKSRPGHPIRDY